MLRRLAGSSKAVVTSGRQASHLPISDLQKLTANVTLQPLPQIATLAPPPFHLLDIKQRTTAVAAGFHVWGCTRRSCKLSSDRISRYRAWHATSTTCASSMQTSSVGICSPHPPSSSSSTFSLSSAVRIKISNWPTLLTSSTDQHGSSPHSLSPACRLSRDFHRQLHSRQQQQHQHHRLVTPSSATSSSSSRSRLSALPATSHWYNCPPPTNWQLDTPPPPPFYPMASNHHHDQSLETQTTAAAAASSQNPPASSPSAAAPSAPSAPSAAAAAPSMVVEVAGQQVQVDAAPGVGWEEMRAAISSHVFSEWMAQMASPSGLLSAGGSGGSRCVLRRLTVQSVDTFGSGKVGFVKFKAEVVDEPTGAKLPGIVFARGGAAAVLIILRVEGSGEKFVVLTEQARVPVGRAILELPAGMLDDEGGDFVGTAAREVKEETGLELKASDLFNLTALLHPSTGQKMFPSPGGSDEAISLFLCQKNVSQAFIDEIQGRQMGLRDHGELIKVHVIPLDSLWTSTSDSKALASLALYENSLRKNLLQ